MKRTSWTETVNQLKSVSNLQQPTRFLCVCVCACVCVCVCGETDRQTDRDRDRQRQRQREIGEEREYK